RTVQSGRPAGYRSKRIPGSDSAGRDELGGGERIGARGPNVSSWRTAMQGGLVAGATNDSIFHSIDRQSSCSHGLPRTTPDCIVSRAGGPIFFWILLYFVNHLLQVFGIAGLF